MPVAPNLANSPSVAPVVFATQSVGRIFNFVGTIAPPLLTLAIAGMGLKILTGKNPKYSEKAEFSILNHQLSISSKL